METAVSHVRSGKGPGLLRLTVPRLSGHSSVDNQAYKTPEEREAEWQRDPIAALKTAMVPDMLSAKAWVNLENEVKEAVLAAKDEALQQPFAEPETAVYHAFSDPDHPQIVGGHVG